MNWGIVGILYSLQWKYNFISNNVHFNSKLEIIPVIKVKEKQQLKKHETVAFFSKPGT